MAFGGVIAVEAHKNSTLKSSRGKNTKAGRPHIHMLLWFCHQFLNPSMEKLQLAIELQGGITRLEKLETWNDVLKTGLYVTKDKDEINMLPSMFTCGSSTCSKSGLVQAKLLVTAF